MRSRLILLACATAFRCVEDVSDLEPTTEPPPPPPSCSATADEALASVGPIDGRMEIWVVGDDGSPLLDAAVVVLSGAHRWDVATGMDGCALVVDERLLHPVAVHVLFEDGRVWGTSGVDENVQRIEPLPRGWASKLLPRARVRGRVTDLFADGVPDAPRSEVRASTQQIGGPPIIATEQLDASGHATDWFTYPSDAFVDLVDSEFARVVPAGETIRVAVATSYFTGGRTVTSGLGLSSPLQIAEGEDATIEVELGIPYDHQLPIRDCDPVDSARVAVFVVLPLGSISVGEWSCSEIVRVPALTHFEAESAYAGRLRTPEGDVDDNRQTYVRGAVVQGALEFGPPLPTPDIRISGRTLTLDAASAEQCQVSIGMPTFDRSWHIFIREPQPQIELPVFPGDDPLTPVVDLTLLCSDAAGRAADRTLRGRVR